MINSSQPYLYKNTNNEKCLFYCYAERLRTLVFGNEYTIRPWKIYHKNYITQQSKLLLTPKYFPEYGEIVLECNPHIYSNKLYYTAGFNQGNNTPIIYYLCSLDIDSNLNVSNLQILQQTFTGTVVGNSLIYANPNKNGNLVTKTGEEINEYDLGLTYIYKINKVFNSSQLIVTGQTETAPYFSLLLDENYQIIKEIKNNNNESVYKCSILDNSLIYTLKLDNGSYESRELIEENHNV